MTHVFSPKWPFFQLFFLGNLDQENVFCDILERKNAFLRYKNKKLRGFGRKMAIFGNFFFLANLGQEKVFYDILERKNAFLVYKNKKFKKSRNGHFSELVYPWVWSKNGYFSNFFFLSNLGQENVFYDILERKNLFLGYKNKSFKNSKNWHFS